MGEQAREGALCSDGTDARPELAPRLEAAWSDRDASIDDCRARGSGGNAVLAREIHEQLAAGVACRDSLADRGGRSGRWLRAAPHFDTGPSQCDPDRSCRAAVPGGDRGAALASLVSGNDVGRVVLQAVPPRVGWDVRGLRGDSSERGVINSKSAATHREVRHPITARCQTQGLTTTEGSNG